MFDAETEVTSEQLALILGCDQRSIRNYAAAGILVRAGKGQFRLLASTQSLFRYLTGQRRSHSSARLDVAQETAALKKAQHELTDLKRQILESEMIPYEDLAPAWGRVARSVRQGVLAIPGRARFALPHLSAQDGLVLTGLCRDALCDISGDRPPQ